MRAADNWKDYRLIDASEGDRLESWSGIKLVRPDPQIIWKTDKTNPFWRSADAIYHRSQKGGGEWEYKRKLPQSWTVSYGELTFIIRPTGFKHTGLFPEQAVNWDVMADMIKSAGRPINVLNMFAYTGGATLAAAAAGAHVTHVDASKGMVAWAKENARSSGLADAPIRWIVDDCVKFVEREIRRGNTYDAIIMDPPSYGRGPGGEVWKLEDALYPLVSKCMNILSDRPLFFLINSYTTGLQPAVLSDILKLTAQKLHGGSVAADEIGLPVENSRLILPCGASGRWSQSQ